MRILVKVDESTYRGGRAGADHPMSWSCEYLGGRAWTAAMGHVTAAHTAKADSVFLNHLWGGMHYLLRRDAVTAVRPAAAESRAGSASRGFTRSGARFGEALRKDAQGREELAPSK